MVAPGEYQSILARAFCEAAARVLGDSAASAAIDPDEVLERPREKSLGDFSSPLPLRLAKIARRKPAEIGAQIQSAIDAPPFVESIEFAPPGFLNIKIKPAAKTRVVAAVLQNPDYGRGAPTGKKILVEFVSANPTGPLHVGHARGAAYGASLADILQFAGFEVRREYYVNDVGRQAELLAASAWLRALEEAGKFAPPMPPGSYRGDYLCDIGKEIYSQFGDDLARDFRAEDLAARLAAAADDDDTRADALIACAKEALGDAFEKIETEALDLILNSIKEDLGYFGVKFDRYFSERKHIVREGKVESALAKLRDKGYLFEKDGAEWFRATDFGDQQDWVVRRANGRTTYFASDIAYHADKLARAANYDALIDVLGQDHHGYVPRLSAAVTALSGDAKKLETQLIQFATLIRNGKRTQMSTRGGVFFSLKDLITSVKSDVARYILVSHGNDQGFEFDLSTVKEKSEKNPVYRLQYAQVRIKRLFDKWGGDESSLTRASVEAFVHPCEIELCDFLLAFPAVLQRAAKSRAPHQLAAWLLSFAVAFNKFYEKVRVFDNDDGDDDARRARLALTAAVKRVLIRGLSLLGVSNPDKM